jgi:hypothetical protein
MSYTRLRAQAAAAVALVMIAAAAVGAARIARGSRLAYNVEMETLAERYSTLKGTVASTTPIGYATPIQPTDPAWHMRQMLARYATAPTTLDGRDIHALALADFDTDEALAAYIAKVGGTLLAHPRPGLAIVRKSLNTP